MGCNTIGSPHVNFVPTTLINIVCLLANDMDLFSQSSGGPCFFKIQLFYD